MRPPPTRSTVRCSVGISVLSLDRTMAIAWSPSKGTGWAAASPGKPNPNEVTGWDIQVTDLAAQVARARELGATIFVESMEIPDVETFAVLDDPTGAPFYLFEIVPEHRVTTTGYDRGPGNIIWNELITNDLAAASDFYREIAGWELVPMSPDPLAYTVAKVDGMPVAGLFQPPATPENSAWIMSVHTADIDATLEKAVELGGSVIHAANTVPGVGRTAWIADPTGGVIGLMQPEAGWLDRL